MAAFTAEILNKSTPLSIGVTGSINTIYDSSQIIKNNGQHNILDVGKVYSTLSDLSVASVGLGSISGVAFAPEIAVGLAVAGLGLAVAALAYGNTTINITNLEYNLVNLLNNTVGNNFSDFKSKWDNYIIGNGERADLFLNPNLAEISNLPAGAKLDITEAMLEKYGIKDNEISSLLNAFGDKSKFEIDKVGNGYQINQNHELFIGVVKAGEDWESTGNDRSELITTVGDSRYTKVGLSGTGTASQVAGMHDNAITQFLAAKNPDGSPAYSLIHDVRNADKQTYLLFPGKSIYSSPNFA